MNTVISKAVGTIGLLGMSAVALAGEPAPTPPRTPHEPVGFIAGGVIGGFAAGPIGAVVGAGIGTWLGNRVHRAGEAKHAEAEVAALQGDKSALQADKSALQAETTALISEKNALVDSNRHLNAQLDDMTRQVQSVRNEAPADTSTADESTDGGSTVEKTSVEALAGLQGDVMFRTNSAEIAPDAAHQIEALAQAMTKAPALKIRLDGYADPRGSDDRNLELSQQRANAVRDLMVSAGIDAKSIEVNAYGKSQSTAADSDGYAFERRVRMTLKAPEPETVAQAGGQQ